MSNFKIINHSYKKAQITLEFNLPDNAKDINFIIEAAVSVRERNKGFTIIKQKLITPRIIKKKLL